MNKKRKRSKIQEAVLEHFKGRRYQVLRVREIIHHFRQDFEAPRLRTAIVALVRSQDVKIVGVDPGGWHNDQATRDFGFPFDSLPITYAIA